MLQPVTANQTSTQTLLVLAFIHSARRGLVRIYLMLCPLPLVGHIHDKYQVFLPLEYSEMRISCQFDSETASLQCVWFRALFQMSGHHRGRRWKIMRFWWGLSFWTGSSAFMLIVVNFSTISLYCVYKWKSSERFGLYYCSKCLLLAVLSSSDRLLGDEPSTMHLSWSECGVDGLWNHLSGILWTAWGTSLFAAVTYDE